MNSLIEVENQCRMLMTAHGVGALGFRFSKGTRQIAALHCQRHRSATGDVNLPVMIVLSKHWAKVLPKVEIWEVMIHEIAHALTVNAGQPHGREFALAVIKMGGKATKRCFSPSVNIDGTPRHKVG